MIEEYHFGFIRISGKSYDYDIEVRWTDEVLPWQRKEGHVFDLEDIQRALEQNPESIIFGTGASGIAKVTESAQRAIKDRGIELIIDKTEEAVKTFNVIKEYSKEEDGKQKKVIGFFHLTC